MSSSLFPAFLKLTGRPVVVVGAGKVSASKLPALVEAGAVVTVIAPAIDPAIELLDVRIRRKAFEPADLDGAWYAVAAAPPEVNREVAVAAERRRIFVNAVDDPRNGSVYLGGVVRRGGVTCAISTNGDAPALAGLIREALDMLLPREMDDWMAAARAGRLRWIAERVPMEERRPLLLRALNELYDQAKVLAQEQ